MANNDWTTLGLSEATLSLIQKAGFKSPTDVQQQAIPIALDGDDIIASAQTGSGKTAAFCLPIIERLVGRRGTYALILCPTREIALQTQETLNLFGTPQGITSASLIGGVPLTTDQKALQSGPHILVGTPGRLCDHLDRGNLWLEYIEFLVLDEADRMLDMGFAKELARLTEEIPKNRQTLLFSATIPPTIDRMSKKILHRPKRITIGRALSAAPKVDQHIIWLQEDEKIPELMHLLDEERGSIIVFSRTKDGTYKLWRKSLDFGFHDTTYISSNKRQSDREKALEKFKSGEFRVLFATDVAGRGIHVDDVGHVVNFDLPKEPEDYVHRIGRTGRKDASGRATSFATNRDRHTVRAIENLLGSKIPCSYTRHFDDRPPPRKHSTSRGGSKRRSSNSRRPSKRRKRSR